jgi:hypothetical protein
MLIGGAFAMVAGFAVGWVRHATVDYYLNGFLGLGVIVFALIPLFKERLLKVYEAE